MLEITDVIKRSDQGITRPFLCKGSDGLFYYVKGHEATRKGLVAELIAARLGRKCLDLPIPDFEIARIPRELTDYSAREDIGDLGSGSVFASKCIEGVREFGLSDREIIDPDLALRILLFDWWVRNDDRRLGCTSGNSNLLWSVEQKKLWVFDHNLAFDDKFDSTKFWQTHVFRSCWDYGRAGEYSDALRLGVLELDKIWDDLPDEWHFIDVDMSMESGLSKEDYVAILQQPFNDVSAFWRM